jgi:hypothetical protein
MNVEIMPAAVCLHCGTEGSHYCESDPERQKRREAYYDKQCWCGHALGNHSPITGACMLCDHSTVRELIG